MMADMIQRDALLEAVRAQFCDGCENYHYLCCENCDTDTVIGIIEDLPAAQQPEQEVDFDYEAEG